MVVAAVGAGVSSAVTVGGAAVPIAAGVAGVGDPVRADRRAVLEAAEVAGMIEAAARGAAPPAAEASASPHPRVGRPHCRSDRKRRRSCKKKSFHELISNTMV